MNWIVIEDPTITGRAQYPVGRVDAVSLDTGKLAWHYEQRAGLVSGLVSTAGGLVFGDDANRRFKALDDETGRVLWETILAARRNNTRHLVDLPTMQAILSNRSCDTAP